MITGENSHAERARALAGWGASAVHGLLGDHLAAHLGGLALGMGLHHGGRALPLDAGRIARAYPWATSKICVLVHGLGCTEEIWSFADPRRPGERTSYGELLHADLAYTPLYVRYNTGRSVAENGAALSELLSQLVAVYPGGVDEIALIGHSMGGLVIRSACHTDAVGAAAWTPLVRHAFYLGTPHDGAHLERLVSVAAGVLRAVPNPITKLIGAIFDLRSQGVKDLRDGSLLAPDVFDGPSPRGPHHSRAVPWLAGARHYLIGGAIAGQTNWMADALLGDGLVTMPAARRVREIPGGQARVFDGVHHMSLARDYAVYEQIRGWCAEA